MYHDRELLKQDRWMSVRLEDITDVSRSQVYRILTDLKLRNGRVQTQKSAQKSKVKTMLVFYVSDP